MEMTADIIVMNFKSSEDLTNLTTIKIIHSFNFPLCLLIGSIFYWGIIYYERFGGDPMKRSLRNKLIAAMATSLLILLHTNVLGTVLTYRQSFIPERVTHNSRFF